MQRFGLIGLGFSVLARKSWAPNRSRQADNQTARVFARYWSKKARAIRDAGRWLAGDTIATGPLIVI
jgi:hypothetical protein